MKPNLLIVYGPRSNAISDFMRSIPESFPLIRIHGKNQPDPRANAIDISDVGDLVESLKFKKEMAPESLRIGLIVAAAATQSSLLVQEKMESIKEQIDVNINKVITMVQACLPHMISTRYGRFVYLSSFRAQLPTRGVSLYSASKAFGESFFKSVGIEYGRFGISSVTIRMGYFEGGLLADFEPKRLDSLTKKVASNRLGSSKDLTSVIDLALDNQYLNGGVINLDGGLFFE